MEPEKEHKLQLAYLPFEQLGTIARVLDFGARKHSRDGWKDQSFMHHAHAFFRHVFARMCGVKYDPETGLPHLAHAASRLLFMMWFDDQQPN